MRVAIEDFAQMDENQRECEIGHILGQDVRSVGDADATGAGRSQIDGVDPHAVTGDDFELGAAADQRGICAEFAARRDCADDLRRPVEEYLLVFREPEFAKVVIPFQGLDVPLRVRADHEDGRLGHSRSLFCRTGGVPMPLCYR